MIRRGPHIWFAVLIYKIVWNSIWLTTTITLLCEYYRDGAHPTLRCYSNIYNIRNYLEEEKMTHLFSDCTRRYDTNM